ncbi:succinate-semialdehyde dehydrogenase [Ensifer sp. Root31]|uniref:NAD-dependent succinate-semialdehyde dehydrogenase n=1 Tax=Ensifer sp. Root31 TaxID=1736512 RepID=UPI00070B1D63|nr:NAD-dependent succinate-semialdehyde dehydrogenase [Ensifer sp. Root31]KQU85648.1 succinate-semialdehyde dehydrogenase [Ensifer sp. Root31]
MIVTTNPATGIEIGRYPLDRPQEVEEKIASAFNAQEEWRNRVVKERCQLLKGVAAVLRREQHRLAPMITTEMGKPIAEAEAEIEKSAWTCDFYAETGSKFLGDIQVDSSAADSRVVFDPLGVILSIMPWNYPFWQFIRCAAPALAAGNAVILKHANNVPRCAQALIDVFLDAGAPEGLVTVLMIDSSRVSDVIADARVAAVALTGSTSVGKLVAAQAGNLLKKQVLELGGSDPFIVLADADVDHAAKVAVKARFSNAGQSCISAKRFIVEETIGDRFVAAFCAEVRKLNVGDPMDRATSLGPLARASLRDELHSQVQRTAEAGGTVRLGGHVIEGPGFYYAPTVIDGVTGSMAAGIEETFGPLAAIIRVENPEDAIYIANETEFGLGASLWTRNLERAHLYSRMIQAGAVFINGMVASDPRLPFGGIKQSGYGRELGEFGIREFTNIKTVYVAASH